MIDLEGKYVMSRLASRLESYIHEWAVLKYLPKEMIERDKELLDKAECYMLTVELEEVPRS